MNRVRIVFTFFIICIILILIRLFYIQVLSSDKYSSYNQYLQTYRIEPVRGKILDRNNTPLVINEIRYLLYADPKIIPSDKKNIYVSKIDSILNIGEATIEAKLYQDKRWVSLKSGIDEKTYSKLKALNYEGLGFQEESTRLYPESSLSAHLLGFVGKNETGDSIGYFGVEGYYEKDLAGLPGILLTERDVLGKPIMIGTQEKLKGEDGRDLVLTVDNSVQMIAKKHLQDGIINYGAKSGCVIVADPYKGEILALVCLPDFDPEKYVDFNEDYFRNPAISDVFEPGSIVKPLIMSAAINEEKVSPSDQYNETGPVKIGAYTISTWDDSYEGKISMVKIIQKSSNVGMVYVGQKLGPELLLSYLKKYGVASKTNIDLQGEVRGFIKKDSDWYEIDYATATFGQGIVMTPIQIIKSFSSIINGGWMITPHIVMEFTTPDGGKEKIQPKKEVRVITKKTSDTMKMILQKTVEYKEANWKVPEGYQIGGKTGTAQIPIEGHYDPTHTIASFIGFAPVEKSKFIVLVMLKEPTSSPWGSETAAPIFFKIASDLLVYYNIVPE